MFLMLQPLSKVLVIVAVMLFSLLASCILLVNYTRWHMQALQWNLKCQWVQHQGNLSDYSQVSEEAAMDLQWWLLDHNQNTGIDQWQAKLLHVLLFI